MRFVSSGIERSNERSPASTCADGTPSFAATRLAASVLLTSPYTTTRAGGSATHSRSSPTIAAAVCSAWVPEPTPRFTSGAGISRSRKNTSDIRSS